MNQNEYLFKIVLIGDTNVGKSNMLSRYIKNEFNLESRSTIGVEFLTKKLIIKNNNVKLQIWDTAGQERYRALTTAFYRNTFGIVLVYDITNKDTFLNIPKWLNEMSNHIDSKTIVILCGNKVDLEYKREVSIMDGQLFAENNNMLFLETSALDTRNINKVFDTIAEIILNRKNIISNNKEEIILPTNYTNISQPQILQSQILQVELSNQKIKKKKKCCL